MTSGRLLAGLATCLLALTGLATPALTAGDARPEQDHFAPTATETTIDATEVMPPIRRTTPGDEWTAPPAAPAISNDKSAGLAAKTMRRVCRVTAYCDRGTTASGTQAGVGQCAAPADIPFGATVYIPELDRTFVVTDRTHRRFRRSTVDIFIPAHRDCVDFGVGYRECVFTLPGE
ncbi:MAG: hypothetical protein JXO22_12650 [Phycisphaerae bacterium]|nr:hypothetical protein [Phycisphaerae bacterium]